MDWKQEALEQVLDKVERNIDVIGERFPHVALDGKFNDEGPYFWTSGFWAGILWLAYQKNGQEKAKKLAIRLEERLDEPLDDFLRIHHDVGFMWLPSSVIHHKLEANAESRRRGLKAASHLAGRFNPAGPFIRAWTDEVNSQSAGWAIIDCMMNLPLLYWASSELDDPRFRQIAIAHADSVLKNFVREDNTVPHIVSFNPETGEKIENLGGQGLGPESVWSRGQAWALYGFAISYRETGKREYLLAAQNIGNAIWSHLPEDLVPYWDFSSEENDKFARDSSAAACIASGFLELSYSLETETEANCYRNHAIKILKSLYDNYADFESNTQGILRDGTVSYPNGKHVNVPIIYGDYFFLEALIKLDGEGEWLGIF